MERLQCSLWRLPLCALAGGEEQLACAAMETAMETQPQAFHRGWSVFLANLNVFQLLCGVQLNSVLLDV